MKIIKRILIVFGVFLLVLVAAAIIIPIVFKDDIKAALDKKIAEAVNADVVFEVDNFSLSVFKNFPNITVQIKDLGVFNRAPFEQVPLFVMNELDVEVNLKDILFGDQMRVKGISLIDPQITIKVLKDGRANYDITYPSTDTVQSTEPDTSKFSFGIDHWEIVNAKVTYDDKSLPYLLEIRGLNHSGSGDFTQDVFDLKTNTVADTVTTSYDGVEYLTNKRVEIDMTIAISEEFTKYTFKENSAKVNDFAMSFDGWFKMNEKDYGMDITFSSPENSFKSLLSLVPGMYTADFGNIKTEGELQFSGAAKGTYSDTQMPAFNLALLVKDAMFKYPDLPTAVNNINMDLRIDNTTGVIDNTVVDLKNLHLDFGANPVDAKLRIDNLKDYKMDAQLKARLNLAELNKMFPMEGLEMKGSFTVDATANGVYDSLKKTIPAVDVAMGLADGYVKSSEFPAPLEDLKMSATVKNTTGKMAETVIDVPSFSMMLEGERFDASMRVVNLDDYTWDVKAKGGVDLEKMTKIFPLEGMTVAGKVKADIQTKGKMSDLDAERYDRLPTSGSASMTAFKFTMKDMPDVTISQSEMNFDPKKIELKNTSGTIGKSDFAVAGAISNYIGYVFGNNETIKGNVDFKSNLLDLNEFMTETEETAATPTDTASYGVIPIPQNIDFILRSSVKTVKMMDYTMTNASGDIILKDGIASLSGIRFNMLGGAFGVSGTYNTKDIDHPKYDLTLKIEDLSIKQAASSFSVVSTYAPIAGMMSGNFGTDFKISGELGQDMMPKMGTVNGAGLIKIAQASLAESKLISGVTSLTKLEDTDKVTLKDVLMSATIDNGRLNVKPFDVKFGSYATNVAGSTGLDGTIAYTLKMNVPAGKIGTQLQGYANQITGGTNVSKDIPVTIGVGGTYKDPKTQLVMTEQKAAVKEAVKEEVKQTTEAVKEEVKQEVQEKTQQAIQEAVKGTDPKDIIKNVLKPDSVKDSTKTTQQLQNKLNNLLKKKKNN
ncbi:MAG TPA: AsmA-like C-terminal region-containing protein [Cyclobacteriaceae bacterium]|nr:AsmA-like C-terminal region-containing protein [Cyclobacteriaceae bacterium]